MDSPPHSPKVGPLPTHLLATRAPEPTDITVGNGASPSDGVRDRASAVKAPLRVGHRTSLSISHLATELVGLVASNLRTPSLMSLGKVSRLFDRLTFSARLTRLTRWVNDGTRFKEVLLLIETHDGASSQWLHDLCCRIPDLPEHAQREAIEHYMARSKKHLASAAEAYPLVDDLADYRALAASISTPMTTLDHFSDALQRVAERFPLHPERPDAAPSAFHGGLLRTLGYRIPLLAELDQQDAIDDLSMHVANLAGHASATLRDLREQLIDASSEGPAGIRDAVARSAIGAHARVADVAEWLGVGIDDDVLIDWEVFAVEKGPAGASIRAPDRSVQDVARDYGIRTPSGLMALVGRALG